MTTPSNVPQPFTGKHEVLRDPSNTRPALWILDYEGGRAVVKDYRPNGFLYRNLIGRFLVWREAKALRKLKGLEGVPRLYGVTQGLALVMEEIEGRSVEGVEKEKRLPEAFFDDLKALVEGFHLRGVAHCDLKRAPNTLVGDNGRPYVVDWSAAILEREFRFFPVRLIYRRFLQDDLNGIIKLQLRHCPESISREELRVYAHRGRLERMIRRIRDRSRALLKKVA